MKLTQFLILLISSLGLNGTLASQTPTPISEEAQSAFRSAMTALETFNSEHSRTFVGQRVPIHYLKWVDEGIPIVMLHGTYCTAHDFARFAPGLIDAGYRPISVDWYGHGSTPIPTQPVSAKDFADDLANLLDFLKVERAVIVGHSRGGMLASCFYAEHPDRVSGLVLVDGGSTCMANYFASLGEDGLNDWMKSGFDSATGLPLAPSYSSLEELFAATWERFGKPDDAVEMFDVLTQSNQNERGRWTRWRQSIRQWLQQDTFQNTFNGMSNPEQAPLFFGSTILFQPLDAFANLDVPILILDAVGRDNQYRDTTPTAENEQLQRLHPQLIEHLKLPTGHFVHRERQQEFLSRIAAFKQRIRK